jgi:hypothetical protein
VRNPCGWAAVAIGVLLVGAAGCADTVAARGAETQREAADAAARPQAEGATAFAPGDPGSVELPAIEAAAVELAAAEPGALRSVAAEPVFARTGPGGAAFEVAARTGEAVHARRFGTRTLELALRTGDAHLRSFPCGSCHQGADLTPDADRAADAHRDIPAVHPAEMGAGCITCHAAEDVSLLALQSGERVTLDHAYRLCAQCHYPQVDAWAAGAHGKRLDGWQGRRVVMACADCHDPHGPALESRAPYPGPRLPPRGKGQR